MKSPQDWMETPRGLLTVIGAIGATIIVLLATTVVLLLSATRRTEIEQHRHRCRNEVSHEYLVRTVTKMARHQGLKVHPPSDGEPAPSGCRDD